MENYCMNEVIYIKEDPDDLLLNEASKDICDSKIKGELSSGDESTQRENDSDDISIQTESFSIAKSTSKDKR